MIWVITVLCIFTSNSALAHEWDDPIGQSRLESIRGDANTLKIQWWNIQRGQLNQRLRAEGQIGPLEQNLRKLIESKFAPTVLALGDYRLETLSADTKRLLDEHYPYMIFTEYGEATPDVGIGVYSKEPILQIDEVQLAWTPQDQSAAESENYLCLWAKRTSAWKEFERTFPVIELAHKGTKYTIVPVHLSQPWAVMTQDARSLTAKAIAHADVAYEVFCGSDNPLANQARSLSDKVRSALRHQKWTEHVIVLGDMNIPTHMSEFANSLMEDMPCFRTNTYTVLSQGMTDAFRNQTAMMPTYPSRTAAQIEKIKIPPTKIDHAFTSGAQSISAIVLPLKGSDHYPIYLEVAPIDPVQESNAQDKSYFSGFVRSGLWITPLLF